MPADESNETTTSFEEALSNLSEDHYLLRLYVTGSTPRSIRAIQNLRAMCEAHLTGRYEIEVIDIYQQPEQAETGQIVVTPTLIKSLPPPVRSVIGDLSDADRVLISLDIVPPQREDSARQKQ